MLTYAVIVFAIAAVGGLLLAASVLRGKLAPWALSIVHALLGATGLIMLVMLVMKGASGRVSAALGVLVVAALGGFYLASMHYRGTIAPKAIVGIHAGVAVIGFLTLLTAAFL